MKVEARMTPFLLVFIYIATLESGRQWARENKIIVPIPPRLALDDPMRFKNTTNRPQFTFEKTSEWSFLNFSRFEPGRSLYFSSSPSISLEDTFIVLACVWYHENSTRSKEGESLTLTTEETSAH